MKNKYRQDKKELRKNESEAENKERDKQKAWNGNRLRALKNEK